ncbi:nucleoside triphosphate hydrolase [Chelativorans sp. AA-79]|uniref:nucleoside triphosphate hydrolase n=1 Tax=Chelativorans sp. AA-79 TaxID=3028735 RepID=UPI0023F8C2E3|nr:nucleoside triphosphate hydrolase [Chelativorans sp. AA-79]WEX12029.1 nucleoside triphosphate hydrolase [Chelativorans sp. AA-79]
MDVRLAEEILARAANVPRFMIAIAGPPAAGKSTFSERLATGLETRGQSAAVVPMDGFHYDDIVLRTRDLSHRKGAPETFDFAGFRTLLQRLRNREPQVAIPIFDRSMELSRAAAAIVDSDVRFLLVEGNYLLLDEEPWNTLDAMFDFTVYLHVPRAELERRLVERWERHGREREAARRWIDTNDLPNIDRVAGCRRTADMVL